MDYYEINVSQNGRHYFATAPRSFQYGEFGSKAMVIIAQDFKKRFPESEGFEVTVTFWKSSGTQLEV